MTNKKKKQSAIKRAESDLKPGFNLIEILSVSFIIGLVVLISYPVINKILIDSKKNVFTTTVNGFINAITYKVNLQEYYLENENITYYIPTKCISLENGGTSPYAEFKESYVVVTYNGDNYDYYYTGRDQKNNGVLLTYSDLLNKKSIKNNIKYIDLSIGIGNREYIYIFSDNCNTNDFEEILSSKNIEEKSSLNKINKE